MKDIHIPQVVHEGNSSTYGGLAGSRVLGSSRCSRVYSDRFKYNWQGDWTVPTAYSRDDIVRVGGKSYVCLETHTADPTFSTDPYYVVSGSIPLAKKKMASDDKW